VAIGVVIASSTPAKLMLQPWVSGLYATPTVALAPLFILWLGVGITSKIVVVATLVVFPVIINTETGLRTTNKNLVETVRSFGANRWQTFTKVSLPSALPFIFAGLRLGIGRGLIGVVVAELFGARAGLGELISESAESFDMPALFAGVTLLAIAGIVLTSGFQRLEKKLIPWRD
jgi:NitT/TauT family transport system permease protein